MKEESQEKPKNQFQLELEAKMKERRARGLTTALSPSPTGMNQHDSIIISDDEDDIMTSFHHNPMSSYKSKWNSPNLNETMQWGDSQLWNSSFLSKDDKVTDSLGIRNRKSPWKESPRSGESQKGFLKSKLSPRSDVEIDPLQLDSSPRSFKEAPFKRKDSFRGGYKQERKILSTSDYVDDSPRSTGSLIDQSLSSVGDTHSTTPISSGQRFLKSNKKGMSVSLEKDEDKSIQDETDSPRPVPRTRKMSLTSPRYVQSQELQTAENTPSATNNDPNAYNSEISSARIRRHASKASAPSPVFQDKLNLSSGKNSPSMIERKKRDSPKSPKDESISLSAREEKKSIYAPGNKHFENLKDVDRSKFQDPELDEKKNKKEKPERSTSLDRQSSHKRNSPNENNKTFSVGKKILEDKLDDIKPSVSRRGSLQIQNKTNEKEVKSKLESNTQVSQNSSSVFDFLTKDVVEPKTTLRRQKSLETQEDILHLITHSKDPSADADIFDKDTSSLCEESISESQPTPIPRRNKNLQNFEDFKAKTERQLDEEAIKRVEDFQNSKTVLISDETNKITDSPNKTVRSKPKPILRKPAKNVHLNSEGMLDTTFLREEIFREWKTEKNKLIKEEKKKKIAEEEKKKQELENKKKDATVSFECWKKQKAPLLKQKLEIGKTKKEEEIEKQKKILEKKQEAAKLYELWKKTKDISLKKEYSKKKEEEERKKKLLITNKEEKQKNNLTSFNTWKQTKDKLLLQKKKEELQTTKVMQKQQNYVKIQKETLSEESYQQWLWRKEEQEKRELKKKRELRHMETYNPEPQQVWRPPSRTISSI